MKELTEKTLLLIDDALARAGNRQIYEAVPDLPLVLQELEAWLEDEHQWRSGHPSNWSTLLQDLLGAWNKLGLSLRTQLDVKASSSREEVRLVRRELKQSKLPPDESMRRRLQRATTGIKGQLLQDDALIAAWTDLVSASGPAEAKSAARLLAKIGQLRGHAIRSLTRELQSILGDNSEAVATLRGEAFDVTTAPDYAGASIAERLLLAERLLTRLPRKANVIVWLLFALAPKMHPPVQKVGDYVTLYDVAWLHQAGESPQLAGYPLPDELIANPRIGISWVAGDRGKPKQEHEAVPYIAARIELQEVWVSEAEDLARASAEALIALASLEGSHVCPWILEDSHVMFIDGSLGPSSHSGPAVFTPTGTQRSSMAEDWTAEVIRRNVERWGHHFPIQDSRMAEAAHLLVWLRKARETWAPARLILCDRVVERVSGWAGFSSPKRMTNEYLRLHWAMNGMRSECGNVGWAALNAAEFSRPASQEEHELRELWRGEIRSDPDLEFDLGERYWFVNPRGVLKKLDWLGERVPPSGQIAERIAILLNRTATGPSAAAWANDLMEEFTLMDARAKRVRNALVHGGPAIEQAADEILPFVETLAEMALYTSVEGRLDGVDLVDHFLNLRTGHLNVLSSLKAGTKPVDALWSGSREE